MTNVSNPFKLMDDLLLDYVFNPLTWRIEYNFGKNAMDVRITTTYLGLALLFLYSIKEKNYFFLWCVLLLATLIWIKSTMLRQLWLQCNKTGKNLMRINGFWLRRGNDFVIITNIYLRFLTDDILSQCLHGAGWLLTLFVSGYLDATDAAPPRYSEFKTVPQT